MQIVGDHYRHPQNIFKQKPEDVLQAVGYFLGKYNEHDLML
ncbi:hypothetical protein NC99_10280 [Sunxiuqinia dokdonensis]|uniref:Uncharacterized protein n=1 Tax=Sunxiuqinia dokdonensis TaxID=1409788 RepID=A0A0L8VCH7_9BACT|nr:hypothetical protein NC99_10280 [Sunxiuqinia dokdonensis]